MTREQWLSNLVQDDGPVSLGRWRRVAQEPATWLAIEPLRSVEERACDFQRDKSLIPKPILVALWWLLKAQTLHNQARRSMTLL